MSSLLRPQFVVPIPFFIWLGIATAYSYAVVAGLLVFGIYWLFKRYLIWALDVPNKAWEKHGKGYYTAPGNILVYDPSDPRAGR
jgi:hypothetical protein